ncbi:EF-P beta-lysylation protein EpmB [Isoalcanivorax indicus]|uniref:EF-P beta-lysylation protein EpmB n=1 Tax=Isoalcanivorax indicus TaxID=2202653 RepID=UPI001FE7360D|nr:EF-P beta-lysylation protein EpmB [Isoalcanivorax indicus]
MADHDDKPVARGGMTAEDARRIRLQAEVSPSWEQAQADTITAVTELLAGLGLVAADLPASLRAAADFPLRVPRSYAARILPGDPDDPLLRQVLAAPEEVEAVPGYTPDPLAEAAHTPVPGVLHKYHGRVLLVVTGACAVHCRYCFRRHFPYNDHMPTPQRLSQALDWLAAQPDVSEVILSGGDPLSLSDRRLLGLLDALAGMPHLRRLRIHSRLPVVIPGRMTPRLVQALADPRWQSVLVLHANHARELAAGLGDELAPLRRAGVTLLNQAVLLRGVNDSLADQVALSEALFAAGVLPYYLHQLDRVAGAAHFAVPDSDALALQQALRGRLPGYLVPRLVREVAGDAAKTPLHEAL